MHVKSTSPLYKNIHEYCIYSTNNIHMSDEDKHDTNYINKHNDANINTRKFHLWARHIKRAVFVLNILMSCHTNLMTQDVLESSFHPIITHERLFLTSTSSFSTSILSFSVCFQFSILMLPEPHTDLDNLTTMQHNLRNFRERDSRRLRRPHFPHRLRAERHGFQRAWQLPGFHLLHYIVIGLGQRRHYARQAARRSTQMPIYSSLEGVCVSQSSLFVVFDRAGKFVGERNVDQSIGFWCHEKHEQCLQQVFWKHTSWESGRWNREICGRKQLKCTD